MARIRSRRKSVWMKNSNGNLFLLSSKEESETPTESQVPSLQFFPLLAELSELLKFLLHARPGFRLVLLRLLLVVSCSRQTTWCTYLCTVDDDQKKNRHRVMNIIMHKRSAAFIPTPIFACQSKSHATLTNQNYGKICTWSPVLMLFFCNVLNSKLQIFVLKDSYLKTCNLFLKLWVAWLLQASCIKIPDVEFRPGV